METWKDIKRYEGLYQVSNLGRVKSLNYNRTGKEKIMKTVRVDKVYSGMSLYNNGKKKNYKVHRLVASEFHGLDINNPKECALHKKETLDKNGLLDNSESNIFVGTMLDNNRDMINKGRNSSAGVKNNFRSKKVGQYTLKLKLIKTYPSIREAWRNGFNQSCISNCCNGKSKTHGGFIWKSN